MPFRKLGEQLFSRGLTDRGRLGSGKLQSSGAAEWTPTTYPNLAMWFDANDPATLFQLSTLATPATADGHPIGAWVDKSGNSRNALQSTVGWRPVLKLNILNSKPVIRFTGATLRHHLKTAALAADLNLPNTVYIVLADSSATVAGDAQYLDGITNLKRNGLYRFNTNGETSGYAGTRVGFPENYPVTHHILVATFTGDANGTVHKNGVVRLTGNMGTQPSSGLSIGAVYNATTSRFDGDVAEILFYNAAHDATQRNQVISYLAEKWGITTAADLTNESITAPHAENPLTTPTYDESGQAVHPDVIDFGAGNTWNGYRYWMAMTPYPNGTDTLENPSILASADGNTWVVPEGLTNPITAYPGTGHQADPCLAMSADGLTMYCYYLWMDATPVHHLVVKSSTDGVTWSAETELFTTANGGIQSPSISYNATLGIWQMWYSAKGTPYTIQYRSSANPTSDWSTAKTCQVEAITGKDVWHIAVHYRSGRYYGFFTYGNAGTSGVASPLYYSVSLDGLEWFLVKHTPLLDIGAAGTWYDTRIHRACAVAVTGGWDLFYDAQKAPFVYRIGRTTVTGI